MFNPTPTVEETTGTPTVRIALLGQDVIDTPWRQGMTIADALSDAEMTLKPGFEIRVNNQPATEDTVLNPEDSVVFVGQIQGG